MTVVDLPPEAILQRPSVLQHVLALLKPADKASSLPSAALHFLLCLTRRIKQALGMTADPELVPASPGERFQNLRSSWQSCCYGKVIYCPAPVTGAELQACLPGSRVQHVLSSA